MCPIHSLCSNLECLILVPCMFSCTVEQLLNENEHSRKKISHQITMLNVTVVRILPYVCIKLLLKSRSGFWNLFWVIHPLKIIWKHWKISLKSLYIQTEDLVQIGSHLKKYLTKSSYQRPHHHHSLSCCVGMPTVKEDDFKKMVYLANNNWIHSFRLFV